MVARTILPLGSVDVRVLVRVTGRTRPIVEVEVGVSDGGNVVVLVLVLVLVVDL